MVLHTPGDTAYGLVKTAEIFSKKELKFFVAGIRYLERADALSVCAALGTHAACPWPSESDESERQLRGTE